MTSSLERAFETTLRVCAPALLEGMQAQYRFAPPRRWRFDYAWPAARAAVECDGGTFTGGRHVRGDGYARDCEKLNAATVAGWRVLRFTSDMLSSDPHGCIAQVRQLVTEKETQP